MNYSVNVEHFTTSHLLITPRKRNPKHSVLHVNSGLVLLRVGKREYVVEAGQTCWIPFECLIALTILPNTCLTRIDLSVRINRTFAHQAGLVDLSELAIATLKRIGMMDRAHPLFSALTTILEHEASEFQPTLTSTPLGEAISNWIPEQSTNTLITQDLQLALRLREAHKQELSGVKEQRVANNLFSGDIEQYRQLKNMLLK